MRNTHTVDETQAAIAKHTQMVRFLKGCWQSRERSQPIRLVAKHDSKEWCVHMSVDQLDSVVNDVTKDMRAIEKEFGFEAAEIGEPSADNKANKADAAQSPQSG